MSSTCATPGASLTVRRDASARPDLARAARIRPEGREIRTTARPGRRAGGGLGGHVPIRGPAALDLDVGGYATFVDLELRAPLSWLLEARLLLAWRFAPRLTLWGGPSFGMHVDDPADGNARLGYGWSARQVRRASFRLRMWPGLAVGVRF